MIRQDPQILRHKSRSSQRLRDPVTHTDRGPKGRPTLKKGTGRGTIRSTNEIPSG